ADRDHEPGDRPRPGSRVRAGEDCREDAADGAPLLDARGSEEEGHPRADPPNHERGVPRLGSLEGDRDRRWPGARRHGATRARPRRPRLRDLPCPWRQRGAGRLTVREVPRHRSAAAEAGAPRAVRDAHRRARAGAGRATGDLARVCSLLDRLQCPHPMRISDRLHDDPDAAGQAGGLRGPLGPRARRLALTRAASTLAAALVSLMLRMRPAGVHAHSLLLESSPAAGATLTEGPPQISLRFNNRIEKHLSTIRVLDERGASRPVTMLASEGAADRLSATVPGLTPG